MVPNTDIIIVPRKVDTDHGCCRGPEQTEFDDLISALRTGDVFGENMKRHEHRNRKSRTSPPRVERMESFLR